jgi:hypothetical protein
MPASPDRAGVTAPNDLRAFSICIPTYNRAHLLGLCLEHLLTFRGQDFELIVGDNCSTDDTAQVLARFEGRFRHLKVVRHPENVGFARNMDSLLRRATRDIVYILSDDDFVFEGALHLVEGVMSARPEVAAVVGKYLSHSVLDSAAQVDYSNAVASILEQGAHQALLDNFLICDGHPFMRREVFQRHCTYWDRAIGLIPLYFQLLGHGKLVVVDKPLFQHLTNGDSLSGSMSEAWFLDMSHADLELAVSGATSSNLRPRLAATRDLLMRLVYTQAVRMATNRGLPLMQWLFLRRLDAIGGAGADLLVKCEVHFMHDFLAARLAQLIGDACFTAVRVAPASLVARLLPELRRRLPAVAFVEGDAAGGADTLALVDTLAAAPSDRSAALALDDLCRQLRLTPFAGGPAARGERVSVAYADPGAEALLAMPTRTFEVMRARYSSDAVPAPAEPVAA